MIFQTREDYDLTESQAVNKKKEMGQAPSL
jgi:hypothetical protein